MKCPFENVVEKLHLCNGPCLVKKQSTWEHLCPGTIPHQQQLEDLFDNIYNADLFNLRKTTRFFSPAAKTDTVQTHVKSILKNLLKLSLNILKQCKVLINHQIVIRNQ